MSKKFQKNDKVFYRTTWVSHNTGIIIGQLPRPIEVGACNCPVV